MAARRPPAAHRPQAPPRFPVNPRLVYREQYGQPARSPAADVQALVAVLATVLFLLPFIFMIISHA